MNASPASVEALSMFGELFTNASQRRDFLQNAFVRHAKNPTNVYIAVAFFTEHERIAELARRGCRVRLLVRLGHPTNPTALRKVIGIEGVQVRYVSDASFHPKLYIFEGACALVGSSNLTRGGLLTNQEINVSIPITDPRYDDLVVVFGEYWRQVHVLDAPTIDRYEKLFDRLDAATRSSAGIEREIERLGSAKIDNISRDKPRASEEDLFIEGYRATYQGYLDAYRTVERIYSTIGKRKVPESAVPIRIEVDSCLSWIRDEHIIGDAHLEAPLLVGSTLEAKVHDMIEAWFSATYRWFDDEIVPVRYPRITATLGSPQRIKQASYDEVVAALSCENSFYDRLRFFKGGHKTHVKTFMQENAAERVRETLTFLLFGAQDPVQRMARCIFDPRYRLNHFGRSAVQELLGWINDGDIPICNSRTLRSLRWLGFDVDVPGG